MIIHFHPACPSPFETHLNDAPQDERKGRLLPSESRGAWRSQKEHQRPVYFATLTLAGLKICSLKR